MRAEPLRPSQDRWRDADGTLISLFCWVEQVAEDPQPGALFSRLHQRGQVVGRSHTLLYMRFADTGQLIGVPSQLLRLLPDKPDEYQPADPYRADHRGQRR